LGSNTNVPIHPLSVWMFSKNVLKIKPKYCAPGEKQNQLTKSMPA